MRRVFPEPKKMPPLLLRVTVLAIGMLLPLPLAALLLLAGTVLPLVETGALSPVPLPSGLKALLRTPSGKMLAGFIPQDEGGKIW